MGFLHWKYDRAACEHIDCKYYRRRYGICIWYFFISFVVSLVAVFEQGVPIFAVWGTTSEHLVFPSTSKNNENTSVNSVYLHVY